MMRRAYASTTRIIRRYVQTEKKLEEMKITLPPVPEPKGEKERGGWRGERTVGNYCLANKVGGVIYTGKRRRRGVELIEWGSGTSPTTAIEAVDHGKGTE